MAIKTFTTGEVLTASDTNTYLANSGLVYITSGTSSGTDIRLTPIFNSNYDNYRIILSNFTTGAVRTIAAQLTTGTTVNGSSYNYGGWYVTYAAGLNGAVNAAAQAYWSILTSSTNDSACVWDIQRPFIADTTTFQLQANNFDASYYSNGNNTIVQSYDGIRITNLTSDTCNFSYAVYGYRKA